MESVEFQDPETDASNLLPGYEDVNSYSQDVLKSIVSATRAANGLPACGDDFDYYSSFRGFRQLMLAEGKSVLAIMTSLIQCQGEKGKFEGLELDDKFDLLVDINDSVLENVSNALDEASGLKKTVEDLVLSTVQTSRPINTSWNRKSITTDNRSRTYKLLSAKGITRPQLKFKEKVDNSNSIFVPIIKEKPNSLKPLALIIEKAEGKEEFSHPYEIEIDRFQPLDEYLQITEPLFPKPIEETPVVIIEKEDDLLDLCKELKKQKEFAVDLEHHSYRTFQGIACLLQISTRNKDYIIDALELRSELHILNEVFSDPKIVKVLHGADMDIIWLQRDFGIYVVNMFDTGQASRVLNFAHFSLAYLLKHYCKVEPDKQFQLADWRIRPLPKEMVKYAQEDTHYLLYIYDCLKNDLINQGNERNNLLLSVFQRSKIICLKKYEKPLFQEDSYLELYKKSKKIFNSRQLFALKKIYSWRDKLAREEDESLSYVLPNHMLLQIAEILPREQQGIIACCNPVPPLVRQQLNELHSIILQARESSLQKLEGTELRLQVAAVQTNVDIDLESILYCPHDIHHGETEMHLPTLLDDDIDTSDALQNSKEFSALQVKTELLLPFSSEGPSRNDQNHVENTVKAVDKIYEIFKTFLSPYQRYKLVKPFHVAYKLGEATTEESTSDDTRIGRIYSHFKRLTTAEESEISKGKIFERNIEKQPSEEVMRHIKEEPDIEIITIKQEEDQVTPLRKKKNKKRKIPAPDIPFASPAQAIDSNSNQPPPKRLSNTPESPSSVKTFQPFDYSETDANTFKGKKNKSKGVIKHYTELQEYQTSEKCQHRNKKQFKHATFGNDSKNRSHVRRPKCPKR